VPAELVALGVPTLIGLAVLGLAAGVGITAIGPGGVLATIGLFLFTDASPATVAGTAIVTHVATGLLGTAAYLRSGELRLPSARRVALTLSAAAVVGTPLGVLANSVVSARQFGVLLGGFCAVMAVIVWRRHRGGGAGAAEDGEHGRAVLGAAGGGVAVVSGMFGLGGPMVAVPLLATLRVPLLPALASAQAQSVVVASVGSLAYAAAGQVSWPLAILVGVPELTGVLIGWKIARSVPTAHLRYALLGALVLLAPYLALHPA
jgi:hypothetical protein